MDDDNQRTAQSRRPRTRRAVIAAGLLAAAGAATGVTVAALQREDGSETAALLVQALRTGDFSAVPLASGTAGSAAQERGRIIGPLIESGGTFGLSAEELAERSDDGSRRAPLTWTWSLPGLEQSWTTRGEIVVRRGDGGWVAELGPGAFSSDLDAREHLELRPVQPTMGRVLDRTGTDVYGPRDVITIGIDKTAVDASEQESSARRLADLLGTDADRLASATEQHGPSAFVPALTIRAEDRDDYPLAEVEDVPGALQTEGSQPLAITRGYAPGVLGALKEASAEDLEQDPELSAGDLVASGGVLGARRDQILGMPGAMVLAVDPDAESERELHGVEATDGQDVSITIDHALQEAATARISGTEAPSAVIALRPSTGDVLAAALGPQDQSYPIGLVGRFAPGSTFKTVTALALLRAGDTPQSTLQCSQNATVDGRTFKNADSLSPELYGPMPLADVIAHSCNTALLQEHERISAEAFADSAEALGFGRAAGEGLDCFVGDVGEAAGTTEHAAALMGQGKVLASPLSMAVVLASVVDGRAVTPRVLLDDESAADAPTAPLTSEETEHLRSMLAGTVDHGGLTQMKDLPGPAALGKTGTAEWADDDGALRLHSWVIVAQGDLAVAAFVQDGSYGSRTAGPIAHDVLAAALGLE